MISLPNVSFKVSIAAILFTACCITQRGAGHREGQENRMKASAGKWIECGKGWGESLFSFPGSPLPCLLCLLFCDEEPQLVVSAPAKQLHCSALQAGLDLCMQLPGRDGEGHAGTCPSVLLQQLDLTQLPTQDKRQLFFIRSTAVWLSLRSCFPCFLPLIFFVAGHWMQMYLDISCE